MSLYGYICIYQNSISFETFVFAPGINVCLTISVNFHLTQYPHHIKIYLVGSKMSFMSGLLKTVSRTVLYLWIWLLDSLSPFKSRIVTHFSPPNLLKWYFDFLKRYLKRDWVMSYRPFEFVQFTLSLCYLPYSSITCIFFKLKFIYLNALN